jgi:hypothetical protein
VSTDSNREYETAAAGYVADLLPHEEEVYPLPDDPSPGMLIARVTERIAQAGIALEHMHRSSELHEKSRRARQTAIFFLGTAILSITAIPHVDPDAEDVPPTAHKDQLLGELDEMVSDVIDGDDDPYIDKTEDEWLRRVLAMLAPALDAVGELEGVPPIIGFEEMDERDAEEEEGDEDFADATEDLDYCGEDEEDEQEIRATIAAWLFETALAAALAGDWFLNFHYQLEVERQRRRGRGPGGRKRTVAKSQSAGSS